MDLARPPLRRQMVSSRGSRLLGMSSLPQHQSDEVGSLAVGRLRLRASHADSYPTRVPD